MQQYEIVIVLTPLLSVDVAAEANAKYSKTLISVPYPKKDDRVLSLNWI